MYGSHLPFTGLSLVVYGAVAAVMGVTGFVTRRVSA